MPKGRVVGPFAGRQERNQETLPKRTSESATSDMDRVGPSVGRAKKNDQDAKKHASVGPQVERQNRKSLKQEKTKNSAENNVRVRKVGPGRLTWDH